MEVRDSFDPRPVVVAVHGRVTGGAIDELCACLHDVLADHPSQIVTFDVADLANSDGVAVDALARLQLVARRHGRSIRLRNANDVLRDLLVLSGLAGGALVFEPHGQAEEREELRIEKTVDGGHPAV